MSYSTSESVIARHYDADYAAMRTESGDVEFYVREARRAGGAVAEFACGTGRVLLPTARVLAEQAGIETVGLDSSPSMLERARANLAAAHLSAQLVEGDMRHADLGRAFALVTVPFRGLSHLRDVDDQLAAFRNFRRHLEPGGRLVFDLFQPNLSILGGGGRAERLDFERPGPEGSKVRRYSSIVPHAWLQLSDILFRWEIEDADGAITEEIADFTMRWFFRYELEHMLARTGFAIEALYGDFHGTPLDAESRELVFVCKATR